MDLYEYEKIRRNDPIGWSHLPAGALAPTFTDDEMLCFHFLVECAFSGPARFGLLTRNWRCGVSAIDRTR